MLAKNVLFFNEPVVVVCDGRCNKAWGINNRPRIRFDDEDDHAYLADDELDEAPTNPGTYEGGHGKPQAPEERMNKWCIRECERSEIYDAKLGQLVEIELHDFSKRLYNQPWKHKDS